MREKLVMDRRRELPAPQVLLSRCLEAKHDKGAKLAAVLLWACVCDATLLGAGNAHIQMVRSALWK